jgi:hypothetical protein
MAKLVSEEKETVTSLSLTGGAAVTEPGDQSGQRFQSVELLLVSGSYRFSTNGSRDYLLCRAPKDEAAWLVQEIRELLAGTRPELNFEPTEPSFELTIRASKLGGFAVEVWLDSGNAQTGIYTGDAAGIRFMTNAAALTGFCEQLVSEFSLS